MRLQTLARVLLALLKDCQKTSRILRKSERDLKSAEQNLMIKQNDLAMGRANITQSTIDKAEQRFDQRDR
jgi:hypothetical protein